VVLLAIFKAPLWLFALIVAVLIVLALHEYLGIAEAAELKPSKWLTYIVGVLPILLALYSKWRGHDLPWESGYLFSMHWQNLLTLAALILGIPLVFRKDLRMGLASVAVSAFGVLYVGVSLSLLINLQADFQPILLVVLLCSVWAGDIAAYYVGKNFGKHKLAPIVSPNKSWEGAIASVVASVAVAVLMIHFRVQLLDFFLRVEGASLQERELFKRFSNTINTINPISSSSTVHAFILGVITNIAAQFGDLFESALKRSAGVKDSGTLLPGHGGILDRIDALLFAIPVVWYYATQTGLLLKYKS
jgi:phosphatidate cytidylyltransferase